MGETLDDNDPARDLYRAYVTCWHVNMVEFEESRPLSGGMRILITLQLMRLANELNWRTSTPEEDEEARRRWRKIKQADLAIEKARETDQRHN